MEDEVAAVSQIDHEDGCGITHGTTGKNSGSGKRVPMLLSVSQ